MGVLVPARSLVSPRKGSGEDMNPIEKQPLLQVRHLGQEYLARGGGGRGLGRPGKVSAVWDVSFEVATGETFGLVGETGCGKSSTARALFQSPRPSSGQVLLRGRDLTALKGAELRTARRPMQMVFQDPHASLDPRWSAARIIEEPLRGFGLPGGRSRALELLHLVGLDPGRHADALPRQMSGGECQRVAIARALAAEPELLVCDEAVSALDVSVRAQILNIFERLRQEVGVASVFITHDLGVVRHVSDRLGVMHLGVLVETGPTREVFSRPRHPYTASLLSSIPVPDPTMRPRVIKQRAQEHPNPLHPPSGCRYRTQCPRAESICAEEPPMLRHLEGSAEGHLVACHFPLQSVPDAPTPAAAAVVGEQLESRSSLHPHEQTRR